MKTSNAKQLSASAVTHGFSAPQTQCGLQDSPHADSGHPGATPLFICSRQWLEKPLSVVSRRYASPPDTLLCWATGDIGKRLARAGRTITPTQNRSAAGQFSLVSKPSPTQPQARQNDKPSHAPLLGYLLRHRPKKIISYGVRKICTKFRK